MCILHKYILLLFTDFFRSTPIKRKIWECMQRLRNARNIWKLQYIFRYHHLLKWDARFIRTVQSYMTLRKYVAIRSNNAILGC